MPKTGKDYTNESISSLKGADRVRLRPGVIFGSDGLEGCEHSIFEIISNAIDEARAGYGNRVLVTRYRDASVEVQDFARGIPVDYNQNEKRFNWELLFCEMYAGGKYADGNYSYSLGLNGLGLCATQYASEYMDVEVKRDGFRYTLRFERGENVGGLHKEPYSGRDTGTKIRWKPDLAVFTDIDVPREYFFDALKRQAVVNGGLKFVYREEEESGRFFEQTFCYPDGIKGYIEELAGEDALAPPRYWSGERTGRDRPDKPEYKVKMEVALAFSNRAQLKEYYHNSSWLEHGGAPDRAARAALTYAVDQYLRQNGKYQKNESKVGFSDIEECLMLCVSSFSTMTSYENQTKKSITNKFIGDALTDFLKENLTVYFIENRADAERITDQILVNKRSRERSERERLSLKKALSVSSDPIAKVQKFVDCRSRDVSQRELFIVEGDSALGSVKLARSAEFQAIIPVRGKILNCLKAEYGKIFKNDIITDLIKVLGCGVETRTKATKDFPPFSIKNLRWSKIILCTDADVDGFQIRTLILTMLYRLTPSLITEGKVFIAESPLYEITTKSKTYFAYDDAEKREILEMIAGEKHTIQRSKGLGENQPDMMSLTTMNPATRRLIRVMPDDAEHTAELFDLLLGDNLQGRKDFIAENGYLYLDEADVS